MFGIKPFVLGSLAGGCAIFFAHNYHVVHSSEGLVLVPRSQHVYLRSTYADVRGWDAVKWEQYPELAAALVESGRSALLTSSTAASSAADLHPLVRPALPSPGPTERPPIIFESRPAASPAAIAPAADDSLLGRLSRQLQTSGAAPARALQERPLVRDVPTTPASAAPVQPAYVPPPATNDRADAQERGLPAELLPSIHSAALQRITSELAQPRALPATEPENRERRRGPARPSASAAEPRNAVEAIEAGIRPLMRESGPIASTFGNTASEAGLTPLEIDGDQLRQRLPDTWRETIRFLDPPAAAPASDVPTSGMAPWQPL